MPNWACGNVEVKGKAKNVKEFCKLFVFDEEVDKEDKNKLFARSFTNQSWKSFEEEYFKNYSPNKMVIIYFCVDFAWSCHSCMVEGYPNKNDNVTLKWACIEYNVSVDITTEESGCGFEEHITCSNKGKLTNHCENMPSYTCLDCGNEQTMSKNADLDDESCYECGNIAWKDKLLEIVKNKIKQEKK